MIAIRQLSAFLPALLLASCSLPMSKAPPPSATAALPQHLTTSTATSRAPVAMSTEAPTPITGTAVVTPTPAPTSMQSPVVPTTPMKQGEVRPKSTDLLWSYPVGIPGRPLGDGFVIRHTYAAENTWFNPGWWHTGEDWYLAAGDSASTAVYAAAEGEVVFAGGNYPGRVVILQHAPDLFSMYGHLDPALVVAHGQRVRRGDRLGTIGPGTARAPAHLHFEIRTFLTSRPVNGSAPRYQYRCGVECPPGPGYWPIDAPEHPSGLGWRDPTAVINSRAFASPTAEVPLGEVVVATQPISQSVTLWSSVPRRDAPSQALGQLQLTPDERFVLTGVETDREDTERRSAENANVWYNISTADGRAGWVQAAVPVKLETGSDGRSSSLAFNFFPAVLAR